jgi:hypothetical protein
MKATLKYDKSVVMKRAWAMFRNSATFTFGQCLETIWASEKYRMKEKIKEMEKEQARKEAEEMRSELNKMKPASINDSMLLMADTISNYYRTSYYTGD